MQDFLLSDIVDGTEMVLTTTSSDEYIHNVNLMNFPKYDSEDDPSYWNKKFKNNDWDHLYDVH